METIILASASPRRRELLEQIGIGYEVIPSQTEEVIHSRVPSEVVVQLAEQKARDVAMQLKIPGKVVLGADTVVAFEGEIMGKPESMEDAFAMIQKIQAHTHQVYTGVCFSRFQKNGEVVSDTFFEETQVAVYPMSEEEIRKYITTRDFAKKGKVSKWDGSSLPYECEDKAGAYGIQGSFAAYIREIRGDYTNVVGLPAGRVYQELKNILK